MSRYNLSAPVPNTKNVAIANLFKGNCAEYTLPGLYLLTVLEELDEHHPIIERFAKRGIIVNFDELAALEVMGRGVTYHAGIITNGYLLTQDIADMLGRVKVNDIQITIDGIGATHDATRHLAGGGLTFDRIVSNLRTLKLPGRVNIRHTAIAQVEDEVSLQAVSVSVGAKGIRLAARQQGCKYAKLVEAQGLEEQAEGLRV